MTLPYQSALILNSITAFVFLFFIVVGYARGLIHQLLDLVGFVASFFLAWIFTPQIAQAVPLLPSNLSWFQTPLVGQNLYTLSNVVVWFVIVVIAVSVVMTFIVKPFAKGIHKIPVAKTLNRILGAFYGLIPATLLAVLACLILTSPLFSNGRSSVEAAGLLKPFVFVSDALLESFTTQSDKTGLLQKLVAGEEITTEDLSQIPSWFTSLGLSDELKVPLEKLIRQESLTPEEIANVKAYIAEQEWTKEDLEKLLQQFSFSQDQISSALNQLGIQ